MLFNTSAGIGGFTVSFVIGNSDAIAAARFFYGVASTASAIANAEPDAIANRFGFTKRTTDSNVQISYTGATGNGIYVDLGSNFPTANSNSEFYYCVIRANNLGYYYYIKNLASGNETSNFIAYDSANMPLSGSAAAVQNIHLWRNNSATATAPAFDLFSLTLEN